MSKKVECDRHGDVIEYDSAGKIPNPKDYKSYLGWNKAYMNGENDPIARQEQTEMDADIIKLSDTVREAIHKEIDPKTWKLEPCPFCKESESLPKLESVEEMLTPDEKTFYSYGYEEGEASLWEVACQNCGASSGLHETQEEAIEHWNSRGTY